MIPLWLECFGEWRPWVAEIGGTDPRHGLAREFLRGTRDYRQANRPQTRGVRVLYMLTPGRLYEINARTSWARYDRYFAICEESGLRRMNTEEVYAWASAVSA